MIRVLLVDDHQLFRHAVKQMLAAQATFEVYEAGDVAGMTQQLEARRCDVVVVDVELPGRSGLDAIGEIKRRLPQAGILFLSMYSESEFGIRALKAGASGYLNKNVAPEDLVAAIKKIAAGERYITPALAELLADHVTGAPDGRQHDRLSAREWEVMRLLATGKRLSEIATILSINVKTVSTYRARVLEKMQMSSNADLIRYAVAHQEIMQQGLRVEE